MKSQRCFNGRFGEKDPIWRRIEIEKIKQIVRARDIAVRGDKIGIAFDSLIQRLKSGEQRSADVVRDQIAIDDLLRAQVKLECDQVLSWTRLDVGLLFRRQFCLELSNDGFSQLALYRKQIGRGPVVRLGPDL